MIRGKQRCFLTALPASAAAPGRGQRQAFSGGSRGCCGPEAAVKRHGVGPNNVPR